MSLDHIRLSQQGRDQLVRLKRFSAVKNWNVLCRWALCVSLAEPSTPPSVQIPADSNVEMSWKTFAGHHSDVYLGLLRQRCIDDDIEPTDANMHLLLRQHIHRGIGYLAGDRSLTTPSDLLCRALPAA